MAIDDLRAMLKPYDPALMKSLEVSRAVRAAAFALLVEPLWYRGPL
jgi:hypothetical protein